MRIQTSFTHTVEAYEAEQAYKQARPMLPKNITGYETFRIPLSTSPESIEALFGFIVAHHDPELVKVALQRTPMLTDLHHLMVMAYGNERLHEVANTYYNGNKAIVITNDTNRYTIIGMGID